MIFNNQIEAGLYQDAARTLGLSSVDDLPGDLTDKELAKLLDYSHGTVMVKRCRGDLKIPSYTAGRHRRTPLSQLIRFKLEQISKQIDKEVA